MKDSFMEWLYFHGEILEKYRFPYFIWVIGIISMLVAQHFYPKVINVIYNFQFFGQFPFRSIIETNINYLIHGIWLIPLIVLGFFLFTGIKIHQKNINKISRY